MKYDVRNESQFSSPVAYLSGVPDYFDRNKILSGYDPVPLSSASLY